ncbi:MAG: co-chaperone GroES [Dehalococcoidia bacterium]|nr:co-chaperone GroES [Planctomycetota bacterium]MCC7171479.1 co-chaperone GroES [Planctomycetota bacterium]NUQ55617.1 co-chaperone GroES [Dehalococcoidia bacterium]
MATKTSKSTTTSVKPLNDHILVRPAEAEEKTKGGIILPDTAREKPAQGSVVALGEGRLLDNGSRATFQLKVGDKVIYSKYAGHDLTIDGQEYKVLQESDVYAVIES